MTGKLPASNIRLSRLDRFGAIRLIGIDIDGTLATKASAEVAEQLVRLCRRLDRQDVRATLATGRAHAGAKPVMDLFLQNGKDTPVVLYNGAVVTQRAAQRILIRKFIPSTDVNCLIRMAVGLGATAMAYNCEQAQYGDIFQDTSTGIMERVHGWGPMSGQRPGREINGLPVDWHLSVSDQALSEAVAILLLAHSLPQRVALLDLESHFSGLTFTDSGAGYIEVRPEGATKASALQSIADSLGIPASHVLTIGDNDNDAEMLSWAGIGVAVADATSLAVSSAEFVSDLPAAQGVIQTLNLVAEARRYRSASRPA